MKRLNLGCGKFTKKGYVNVDIINYDNVDVIWNLNNTPYPFQDNEFDEIEMINVLEHLEKPYKVVEELWRISKPNCKIHLITPHYTSQVAWEDMTHIRPFSANSFHHYDINKDGIGLMNKDNKVLFEVKINFLMSKVWRLLLIKTLANKFPNFYEKFLCFIFQSGGIEYFLEVRK